MAAIRPWKAVPGGAQIDVRLTPRGGRDAIDGVATLADGQSILKVRVRAVPSDGDANEALMRVVARALGVPPSAVRLLSGETTRRKRLTIDGDARVLVAALEKIAG